MDVILVKKVRPPAPKQPARRKPTPRTSPRHAACFLCRCTLPEALLEAHVQQCLQTSKAAAQPKCDPPRLTTEEENDQPEPRLVEPSQDQRAVEQPQGLPPEPPSKTTLRFFDTFKFAGPTAGPAGAVVAAAGPTRVRSAGKSRPPKAGAGEGQEVDISAKASSPGHADLNAQNIVKGPAHTVEGWLCGLGLGGYVDAFLANGYDTLAVCGALDAEDLDALRVLLPGARKKLLLAAAELRRATAEARPAPGQAGLDAFLKRPGGAESASEVLDDDAEKENRELNAKKRLATPPKRTPLKPRDRSPPPAARHPLLDARNDSELARAAQAALRGALGPVAGPAPRSEPAVAAPAASVCRTADDVRARVLPCLTPDRPARAPEAAMRACLADVNSQVFRFFSSSGVGLKYQNGVVAPHSGTTDASSSPAAPGIRRSLWASAACLNGASPSKPAAAVQPPALPAAVADAAAGGGPTAMAVDGESDDEPGVPPPPTEGLAGASPVPGGHAGSPPCPPLVEDPTVVPGGMRAPQHDATPIREQACPDLSQRTSNPDEAPAQQPPLSVSSSVVVISPDDPPRPWGRPRLAGPLTPKRLDFDLDAGLQTSAPLPDTLEPVDSRVSLEAVATTRDVFPLDGTPLGRSRLVECSLPTPAIPTPRPQGPPGFWGEVLNVRQDCWRIYLMKKAEAITALQAALGEFDAVRDELLSLQQQSLQHLCQHYGVDAADVRHVIDADLPGLAVSVAQTPAGRCEVLARAELQAMQRSPLPTDGGCVDLMEGMDQDVSVQLEAGDPEVPEMISPRHIVDPDPPPHVLPARGEGDAGEGGSDSEHESEELFSPDCRIHSGGEDDGCSGLTPTDGADATFGPATALWDASLDASPLPCWWGPAAAAAPTGESAAGHGRSTSPCSVADGSVFDREQSPDVLAAGPGGGTHNMDATCPVPAPEARKAPRKVTIASPRASPGMPDYDAMALPELKRLISTYGVKPKSREFMVTKLKQIWARQHGGAQGVDVECAVPVDSLPLATFSLSQATQATQPTQSDAKRVALHRRLVEAIKQAPAPPSPSALDCRDVPQWQEHHALRQSLYERILLGETVDRDEVLAVLAQGNVSCPKVRLEEFLDAQGVSWKRGWKRRRPPEAE